MIVQFYYFLLPNIISEIATKASIASGSKLTEKKQVEDDFWADTSSHIQVNSTKSRSSSIKTNEIKEIDQGGWGEWNDAGGDGKNRLTI